MSYPKAHFQLYLGDKDITERIDDRLVSLSLSEAREDSADQLEIKLDDSDGLFALPGVGHRLKLNLGWDPNSLVEKGIFIIDEVNHEGAPDTISIKARSAELNKPIRTRRDRSFHDTTLGKLVAAIAKDNKLLLRMSESLKEIKISHLDQHNESDLHFLTRLGKEHDAVTTIKKDRLLFLSINEGKNSQGNSLPVIEIHRSQGDKHHYHTASRDNYSGVSAQWHDTKEAKLQQLTVGKTSDSKQLRRVFPSKQAANQAAKSEMHRVNRNKATLSFSLALARPDISPMSVVRFTGIKAPISQIDWLVKKVSHSLSGKGFTTQLEMETKANALDKKSNQDKSKEKEMGDDDKDESNNVGEKDLEKEGQNQSNGKFDE